MPERLADLPISHVEILPTSFDDVASTQWYTETAAALKNTYGKPTREEERTLTWEHATTTITLEGSGLNADVRSASK